MTDTIEAKQHSHLMLQIFIKSEGNLTVNIRDKKVCGNYIIIDSGVEHSIDQNEELDCFILLEATASIAKQFQKKYIRGNDYSILPVVSVHDLFSDFLVSNDEKMYEIFIKGFFSDLDISIYQPTFYDENVKEIIQMLNNYSCLDNSINEIAKHFYLSASRLSHIFRGQTGIPLKSYIVLYKLKKAYLLLFQGKNITEASIEAGFFSPSHLADVNRRMMGMSITAAINNSCFLEVLN